MSAALFQLQAATQAARKRAGDDAISTRTDSGRVQVVRAVFDKAGASEVQPMSGWLSAADAVAHLERMQ